MKEIEHYFDDEDFENLAENTDKYSGSDIEVVVSQALLKPLERLMDENSTFMKTSDNKYRLAGKKEKGEKIDLSKIDESRIIIPKVTNDDFTEAVDECKATVSEEDLNKHEEFTEKFGQDG